MKSDTIKIFRKHGSIHSLKNMMQYSPQILEGCIYIHFTRFAEDIQNKDTGPYALQNDHSSAII